MKAEPQINLFGWTRCPLSIVLAAVALVLLVGGAQLALLGGTPYYLIAGVFVAISAFFIWRDSRRAIWAYGIMFAGTVLWAIAEVGADAWGLQSRLLAPALLGIAVSWPLTRGRRLAMAGSGAAVAAVAVAAVFWTNARAELGPGIAKPAAAVGEWRAYGGDLAGSRYSELADLNPSNVARLTKAWTFHFGPGAGSSGAVTPLMVNQRVFVCSSSNVIAALDAESGKELWRFDPKVDPLQSGKCRGVAYFEVIGASGACATRIVFGTTDARLMAVDAGAGIPCQNFGSNGAVDLKRGMGVVRKGYYFVSAAPTIARGKVIVGGRVMDGQMVDEPSGVVRAFDAVTGKLVWAWDMEHPNDPGEPTDDRTYARGTPNSWAPMSADENLGLLFVPTGNATPDYWGGQRSPAMERHSSAVVALDLETGRERWTFQTTHHDLWDYDVSSQPSLIDLPTGNDTVPALVQLTKRGEIFLLDRRTGRPLTQVVERSVPQGPSAGDFLSPTQPFSTGMPGFNREILTERSMWGMTPLDQMWCRIQFKKARYEGPLTPPGVHPTITYPGFLGGFNWGGAAFDVPRHLMIVNWSRMATYTRLVPRAEVPNLKPSADGSIHVGDPVAQMGTPFAAFTQAFLSPLGVPCTEPPFGKIAAVNLTNRKIVWEKPLGSASDSGPMGMRSRMPLAMGVPTIGGSLVTAGGLTFVGASQERAIRALDTRTGAELWKAPLAAGGHANPMTYRSARSGRQFVVISAGGSALMGSGVSDEIVAFALP